MIKYALMCRYINKLLFVSLDKIFLINLNIFFVVLFVIVYDKNKSPYILLNITLLYNRDLFAFKFLKLRYGDSRDASYSLILKLFSNLEKKLFPMNL